MEALKRLPLEQMKSFGLYKDGKYTISDDQLKTLKNGGRTDVVELKDLKNEQIEIKSMLARLSIVKDANNKPTLQVDPVFKQALKNGQLTSKEQKDLETGTIKSLPKTLTDKDGIEQKKIYQYDKETRQILSYDPNAIQIPERANDQQLTPEQKRKLREGKEIALNDGTTLQIDQTESKGIRSNRSLLVLSIVADGGLSYMLISGIKAILPKNKEKDQKQATEKKTTMSQAEYMQTSGFKSAIIEARKQIERRIATNPNDKDAKNDLSNVMEASSRITADGPQLSKDSVKRLNSQDMSEAELNPKSDRAQNEPQMEEEQKYSGPKR
jgi:hypothetical protein